MKTFFIAILVIFTTNAFSQQLECEKYKHGTFFIEKSNYSEGSTIIRTENIQIEKMDGINDSLVFIVNWINSCSYTLTPTKKTLKSKFFRGVPKNAVLTVTITETKEKSYIAISKSNFATLELTTEIFIKE